MWFFEQSCSRWQYLNWYSASRGSCTIGELLVLSDVHVAQPTEPLASYQTFRGTLSFKRLNASIACWIRIISNEETSWTAGAGCSWSAGSRRVTLRHTDDDDANGLTSDRSVSAAAMLIIRQTTPANWCHCRRIHVSDDTSVHKATIKCMPAVSTGVSYY